MIGDNAKISKAELARIAKLHSLCLEDSLVTSLGPSVVKSYYRFVMQSQDEHLFLEREEGEIVGACMLSHDPKSLSKRWLKHDFLLVGFYLGLKFLINNKTRKKIFHSLFKKEETPDLVKGLPEVVQIYTDASYRNKKIGTRLLSQVENYLKQNSHKRYFLKTVSDKSNQAIPFYRKRKFVELGEAMFAGRSYLYLAKEC